MPQSFCTARYTATAALPVTASEAAVPTSGRRIRLKYTPFPAGETKVLPRRPRPSVCSPAKTSEPWGAPAMAHSLAVRFELGSVLNTRTCPG